jgi:NhaP-type Na+/H+ or K+/H+ antiporter
MHAALTEVAAFALVLGVGAAAHWLAWCCRLPAILLLLLAGFLLGPTTGLLDPDRAFGRSLRPFVSLAVALILFEGGLSLRFQELRGSGKVVRNLVTIGAAVTWALSTLAGVWLGGVELPVALLVGAIVVLTGPTVVIPLVRHVRPRPPLGPILRWEGILIDPIGAMLALLVLEASTAAAGASIGHVAIGLLRTVVGGGGLGLVAGVLLARAFERFVVPDLLHVPVTIGVVAVTFAGANAIQQEAGLLAVTVLGMVLANRPGLDTAHIVEWKEQLVTLLLSVLFVCIAARLPLEQLTQLGWRAVLYTAALVLVVRPVAVWASTLRTGLPWPDRVFLMAMAPRGIVVAAVSAEFSLHWADAGRPGAESIVALVFPVIVLTVSVYGLGAGPLARWLGVARPDPQGVLVVGAGAFGREVGAALRGLGLDVLLVDTNARHAALARTDGFRTWHGSILSSRFAGEAELAGIGSVLALTPSAEVNRLAVRQLLGTFGRARSFRAAVAGSGREGQDPHQLGRIAFGPEATLDWLQNQLQAGARVRSTKLTEQFGARAFRERNPDALVLFVLGPDQVLQIAAADQEPQLRAGATVVWLGVLREGEPVAGGGDPSLVVR